MIINPKTKLQLVSNIEKHAEEFEAGILPKGFAVFHATTADATTALKNPKHGTELAALPTSAIATYNSHLDVWVLSNLFSPDNIPCIGGKPTISKLQFNASKAVSDYAFYVSPNFDATFNGENAKGNNVEAVYHLARHEDLSVLTTAGRVQSQYNEIPEIVKSKIEEMFTVPTEDEIAEFLKNKCNGHDKNSESIILKPSDVLTLMFGKSKRWI